MARNKKILGLLKLEVYGHECSEVIGALKDFFNNEKVCYDE